ncbi:MAG: hypothetical protein ACM3SS_09275, partial [Rhodospirillaceae bacterium]
ETASPKQKQAAQKLDTQTHVLPDRPFKIKQWPRMNADVRLTAERIQRPEALPIEGLSAHLVMQNSQLTSNLVLELAGLDLAEAARIFLTRDPQVELRCAAAELDVKEGLATTRTFVVDTEDTLIGASGRIDFKREFVDLVVHPAPKDPSPFVLRTPLIVSGPFKDLGVKPQIGPLAARGAAAALLAAVNPLLSLAAFIETGPGKDSDCGKLADEVRLHAAPGGRNEAQAEAAAKRNQRNAKPVR